MGNKRAVGYHPTLVGVTQALRISFNALNVKPLPRWSFLHAAVAVAFGLQFRRGGAGVVGVAADAGIVDVVRSWLVHRV